MFRGREVAQLGGAEAGLAVDDVGEADVEALAARVHLHALALDLVAVRPHGLGTHPLLHFGDRPRGLVGVVLRREPIPFYAILHAHFHIAAPDKASVWETQTKNYTMDDGNSLI